MYDELGIGHEQLISSIIDDKFPEKDKFTFNDILEVFKEAMTEEGKKYLLDSSPTIRSRLIYKRFVEFLFSKNASNLDTMMLLTAMKGGGKSSVAIQFAREWCRLMGWKFIPEKYIAYSNADLSRKIDILPPFSPLIADEAVKFCTSADWAKKENKELKKKLAVIREKHLFFILCFPLKIHKVEKTYLESFVNYWMEVYSRGYGAVFVRDSNPVFDSWRLDMFKKIGAYNEFTPIGQVEDKLRKHPNFWKVMKIPKVPKGIYAKYKAIRDANIYSDDSIMKSITKEDVYKSALLMALNDVMTNDKTFTMHRIGLHIRNNYDITVSKNDMANIIADAKQMVNSVRGSMMEM